MGEFVGVDEAARIIGVTRGRIYHYIWEGRLVAEKLNKNAWLVDYESVLEFARRPRKPGPRGKDDGDS